MYIICSHPSHTCFPFSIPLPPSDPFPSLSSTLLLSSLSLFLSLDTIYEEEKKHVVFAFLNMAYFT